MENNTISRELAQQEVEKWLDFKRYRQSKREENKDSIEQLVNAVSDGLLILNDDFSWTQKLIFPIGEGVEIKELKYRPRLNSKLTEPHLKGIKASDIDARLNGIICALTDSPKPVVASLDTEDKGIATTIAVFFL
jgi:hypothetical protein